MYFKDQDIFTTNESVNPYDTRGRKLLFIPQVNTTHYDINSLRYNGPVIWNEIPISEIPINITTSLVQVPLNLNIT